MWLGPYLVPVTAPPASTRSSRSARRQAAPPPVRVPCPTQTYCTLPLQNTDLSSDGASTPLLPQVSAACQYDSTQHANCTSA